MSNMEDIAKYLGYTFYAPDDTQMDSKARKAIGRIEAILFSRQDLEDTNWSIAWKNIKKASKIYGENNVSFHFPVDDCDYIYDKFVRSRLIEAINRSADLGLRLVVLHANQRLLLDEWKNVDVSSMRINFINELYNIVDKTDKGMVIGLENMPPIGNRNDDADPLFIFPSDFKDIDHPRIKITFDINHYFNVVATMEEAKNNRSLKEKMPSFYGDCDYMDFQKIQDKIIHWHFSGFDNIANPLSNQICREGCCPWESKKVREDKFKEAARFIIENNKVDDERSVIFEVQDKDYSHRINVLKTANWFMRQGEKDE
ncbi:TIM barrel protein [Clostridium cibarium]|uniref:TIM barrel protein n=2 Tax=Clostridium TaxID=1485 RepID=A0ABR8PXJ3_9CLOT|nr:TIM barrel protein [Clostridium cibarium]MBD7912891.1 TIM barrel protein [Clostridium cibarium]